jgi:hypothetical protein
MFTFNKTTGTYNVDFGNVPQTSKLKMKQKKLLPDDQDPIFLVPLPIGSIVVFDNETARYTRKEKGKERMPDVEPEILETESQEDWLEPEMDDVMDDVMDDTLDDTIGPAVVNTESEEDEEDEEDEIYQMELQLQQELEPEEEEKKQESIVISRDDFIEKHNDVMAKGVVRAIREARTLIPKEILEKTPEGLYDKAQMVKLSYQVSAAQNEGDLNDAEAEFMEAVQSKSLVFKRNYSNREAVVIQDVAENIYHVAWHGAGAEGGNPKEDWESIKSVMAVRFDKDPQFIRADEDLSLFLQHIADINPEARVRLTGYSLGGAKSLHLAEKYNLEGTHINAFISPLSDYERAETDPDFMAKQEMTRITDDPFTAQSAIPPLKHPTAHKREYKNLLPLKENTKFDDSHSLDQFTSKRPRGVNNLVEKTNIVGKSLGHAAIVGGAVYGGYEGVVAGRDNSGTLSEEVYRGVLGAGESSLPIIGEGDILESGIIGFKKEEVSNAFSWVKNSIFGKKSKPEEPDVPAGFRQVSGEGFTTPTPTVDPPTRRVFGPEVSTQPLARRQFGPMSSPQPFPRNPNQPQ